MDPKKWYASKTFWFNLAYAVLVAALNSFSEQKVVSGDMAVAGGTIMNLILRTLTKQPITT